MRDNVNDLENRMDTKDEQINNIDNFISHIDVRLDECCGIRQATQPVPVQMRVPVPDWNISGGRRRKSKKLIRPKGASSATQDSYVSHLAEQFNQLREYVISLEQRLDRDENLCPHIRASLRVQARSHTDGKQRQSKRRNSKRRNSKRRKSKKKLNVNKH